MTKFMKTINPFISKFHKHGSHILNHSVCVTYILICNQIYFVFTNIDYIKEIKNKIR